MKVNRMSHTHARHTHTRARTKVTQLLL